MRFTNQAVFAVSVAISMAGCVNHYECKPDVVTPVYLQALNFKEHTVKQGAAQLVDNGFLCTANANGSTKCICADGRGHMTLESITLIPKDDGRTEVTWDSATFVSNCPHIINGPGNCSQN